MEHLTKEQLETLTGILDARYEKLMASVKEHVAQSRDNSYPDVAGSVGDPADQALADVVRDSDNAAIGRDIRELREIEAARKRIADGNYGECVDCGGDIGYERLQVYPTAARCIRCQSIHERTYAHPETPSV